MVYTNAVDTASYFTVAPKCGAHHTNNSRITEAQHTRQIKELDDGILPNEHELYIGERL